MKCVICSNDSRKNKDVHFHSVRLQWKEILELEDWAKKKICSDHFDRKCYSLSSNRYDLLPNAMPTLDLKRKSKENKNKKIRAIRRQNSRQRVALKELKSKIAKLESENNLLKENQNILDNIDPVLKHLLQPETKVYSDEVKQFVVGLYCISSEAYEFIRSTFSNKLPHPKSIWRWCKAIESECGCTKE